MSSLDSKLVGVLRCYLQSPTQMGVVNIRTKWIAPQRAAPSLRAVNCRRPQRLAQREWATPLDLFESSRATFRRKETKPKQRPRAAKTRVKERSGDLDTIILATHTHIKKSMIVEKFQSNSFLWMRCFVFFSGTIFSKWNSSVLTALYPIFASDSYLTTCCHISCHLSIVFRVSHNFHYFTSCEARGSFRSNYNMLKCVFYTSGFV